MEEFEPKSGFRDLLRARLTASLGQVGYVLTYDNQSQDQSISQNWVFRLQYLGKNRIEIYNDDYRDYTEYFMIHVNGQELFVLNLNNYKSIETAFDELTRKLMVKL